MYAQQHEVAQEQHSCNDDGNERFAVSFNEHTGTWSSSTIAGDKVVDNVSFLIITNNRDCRESIKKFRASF